MQRFERDKKKGGKWEKTLMQMIRCCRRRLFGATGRSDAIDGLDGLKKNKTNNYQSPFYYCCSCLSIVAFDKFLCSRASFVISIA